MTSKIHQSGLNQTLRGVSAILIAVPSAGLHIDFQVLMDSTRVCLCTPVTCLRQVGIRRPGDSPTSRVPSPLAPSDEGIPKRSACRLTGPQVGPRDSDRCLIRSQTSRLTSSRVISRGSSISTAFSTSPFALSWAAATVSQSPLLRRSS